jgi:hypothetical protein
MARWRLALILLGCCGGQAARGGQDAGSTGSDAALKDAADCIEVSPSQFQTSCSGQADCALIAYGRFCHSDGTQGKGVKCNGAINIASQAQYDRLVGGYQDSWSCVYFGGQYPLSYAECINGECSACWPTGDGGSNTLCESDGGSCTAIVDTIYDVSCHSDPDCVAVPAGIICTGVCACPTDAVSASAAASVSAAIAAVKPAACHCPAPPAPRCISNRCTL